MIMNYCYFHFTVHNMSLLQAVRPDRVVAAAQLFVGAVLGETFMQSAEREVDLATITEKELTCNVPALLCSVPGFDATSRVSFMLSNAKI